MARSSIHDPLDKFRFQVLVFPNEEQYSKIKNNNTKNFGLDTLSLSTKDFSTSSSIRAGFSDVSTPRASINTIKYRENIDNLGGKKQPGLVTYDPISLKRGSTLNQELYEWYQEVNNDAILTNNNSINIINNLGGIAPQDFNFRREVLISVYNRDGSFSKHWLLFNAYPASYKGASDLSSSASEKLLEELTIEYESFLEVTGDTVLAALEDANKQATSAAKKASLSLMINAIQGVF